jgi:site-specific DNA recombinase
MTARVAIYARVSTVNHGQDVSMQTRELRQFAEARGWNVAGEYIDAGVSGAKDSRPELNRLMADSTNGGLTWHASGSSIGSRGRCRSY